MSLSQNNKVLIINAIIVAVSSIIVAWITAGGVARTTAVKTTVDTIDSSRTALGEIQTDITEIEGQVEGYRQNRPLAWTLVYSHGRDGDPIYGNKSDLVKLVENGAPVRIRLNQNDKNGVSWTFDAARVGILDDEVYAISTQAAAAGLTPQEQLTFDPKQFESFHAIDTQGNVHVMSLEPSRVQLGASWFVQK